MKEWALTLILLSLFALLAKNLLTKKNASLTFLLSLCTVLALFSPVIRIREIDLEKWDWSQFFLTENESVPKGEELILQRLGLDLRETVQNAFPNAVFALDIHSDENGIPTEIFVSANTVETAQNICDYIQIRYGIETFTSKKEEP